MEDHISRYTDERGHPNAVAQDGGPLWVVVVEQPDLWREGQETDDDELDVWGGGGGGRSRGHILEQIKQQRLNESFFMC